MSLFAALFNRTEFADLAPLLQGYFNARVGAKRERGSYQAIAATLALKAHEILFLSDRDNELKAA